MTLAYPRDKASLKAHIRQNPTPVSERLFHRQVIEQRLCGSFAPSFIVLDCQPSLPSQMQWHYLWYSTRLLPAGVSECLTLPYFQPRTMFRNAGFAAHINQGYNKSETHTLSKFRQCVLIIDFGCHWGQRTFLFTPGILLWSFFFFLRPCPV